MLDASWIDDLLYNNNLSEMNRKHNDDLWEDGSLRDNEEGGNEWNFVICNIQIIAAASSRCKNM